MTTLTRCVYLQQVLEAVIDKRLSASLSAIYGASLTCQLTVAQAHLFTSLAAAVSAKPQFPENE
jgi:hypothetical protein